MSFPPCGPLVRSDAEIAHPKDLEGRKVGVRAYSLTTEVWTRGLLQEEFDLENSAVTWVFDDEEHAREMPLPTNVEHTRPGVSLYDMMAAGDLAASFSSNAGIGRTDYPTGGWQVTKTDQWPDLFPNAETLEAEWYARICICPIQGTIVVKDRMLAKHPWITKSLFDTLERSKQPRSEDLHASRAETPGDRNYLVLTKIVGPDLLSNDMAANRSTVEALERIAAGQRLTPRRMALKRSSWSPKPEAWHDTRSGSGAQLPKPGRKGDGEKQDHPAHHCIGAPAPDRGR